jgi:Sec-independent protein translocase protein TatA
VNIMGIGLAEAGVILLVAFLVLGPNRSITMARTAGKVFGELRRSFTEMAAAVSQEQGENSTALRRKAPPPEAGDEPPRNAGNE